jgi:hypothetical protein
MPDLDYAILPVTPVRVAIAYDCGHIKVVGPHTTAADEVLLNELQLSNAVKCVYSSVALNAEQEKYAGERLSRKSTLRGKTNDESWTVVMRMLAPSIEFSFLRNLKATER